MNSMAHHAVVTEKSWNENGRIKPSVEPKDGDSSASRTSITTCLSDASSANSGRANTSVRCAEPKNEGKTGVRRMRSATLPRGSSTASCTGTTTTSLMDPQQRIGSSGNTHSNDVRVEPKDRTRKRTRIVLMHSNAYTQVLHRAMQHIHQDRDLLLASLLRCCGFVKDTPHCFSVVSPKMATRAHLEQFHSPHYLDWIEYKPPPPSPISRTVDAMTLSSNLDSICLPSSHSTNHSVPAPMLDLDRGPMSNVSEEECVNEEYHGLDGDRKWKEKQHWKVLDSMGLTEDCHLPETTEARALLWNYCLSVAGASLHAAQLLTTDRADVALHWGGGRHHAHHNRAGGFCYINDAVLAIQHLQSSSRSSSSRSHERVLYLDIDVHHADGVQTAFYETDQVLTVSFHRHASGFFPSDSGSVEEKGRYGTPGVGYNLNIPMPRLCSDQDFLQLFTKALRKLVEAHDPDVVVLAMGADGLAHDPLVGHGDGWNLTPEALSECVRRTSLLCSGQPHIHSQKNNDNATVTPSEETATSGRPNPTRTSQEVPDPFQDYRRRKLLILGGGGYCPHQTARTFLLCTAASCEGARPGLLWNELPHDIPQHEYFPRYGPAFELIRGESIPSSIGPQGNRVMETPATSAHLHDKDYHRLLRQGRKAVDLAFTYIHSRRRFHLQPSKNDDAMFEKEDDKQYWEDDRPKKRAGAKPLGGRRRRKKPPPLEI